MLFQIVDLRRHLFYCNEKKKMIMLKLYDLATGLMGMQCIMNKVVRRVPVAHKPMKSREELLIELIEKEQNQMYRMAFSYVKNEQDALDVVQEAVYKAIKYQEQIKDLAFMKTWLLKILIRSAHDLLESKKRVLSFDPQILTEVSDQQSSRDEGQVGKLGDYIDLREALGKLPERQRQILELRYFEDFKLETIAEMLELPLSTVKSNLYRTLEALKLNLEGEA